MKTVLILVIIFSLNSGLCADYDGLRNYKKNHLYEQDEKKQKFAPPVNRQNRYKDFIELTYYDINKMDTDLLEKKYSLLLWLCIADGICVFKYEKDENIDLLILKIKKEELEIKSVKKYNRFNLKPF